MSTWDSKDFTPDGVAGSRSFPANGPVKPGFELTADGQAEIQRAAFDETSPLLLDHSGTNQPVEPALTQLGAYDLLGEIARGGMGVVYRARHRTLNRVVALKVSRAGLLATPTELKRFQAEVAAAGQLDHPHIVPIYEAGEADGYHYFSMALVEGKSLAERIVEHPMSPREAAGLMRQTAAAVAYAHDHGVIHRDLKPGNILLDATGQPRVTDFGLAKRTGTDSSLTQAGQVMGTPSFMPPEQAQGKNDRVGPLSDVYALGATLYALLTSRPPFQSASVVDTLKQVVEQEPIPPRSLNSAVDRDLNTICLKCLQKRPERRYASAAELADDLQRFLDRRPIAARPVSAVEKGLRWCQRNPGLATSISVVVSVFLAAFVLVMGSYYRAEQALKNEGIQRRAAEEKEKAERWERYRSNLIAAGSAMRLHNVAAARDSLDAAPEEHRGWEWKHFYHQLDLASFVHPGFGTTSMIEASSDGRFLASFNGPEKNIHFFDTMKREQLVEIPNPRNYGFFRFNQDGRLACFTASDNLAVIWNVAEKRQAALLRGHTKRVTWLNTSADGRRIATASEDGTARVWELTTGKPLLTIAAHEKTVSQVHFSADSQRLLTIGGDDRRARLWDAVSGKRLGEFAGFTESCHNLHACPVGERLAATEAYPSNRIRILDTATCREVAVLAGHTNQILGLAFSPDGTRLASCSLDQTVRLWDPHTGQLIATLTGHSGWVNCVAFSPDSRRLVSASHDQTVRLWDGITGAALSVLHGHTTLVEFVAYLPDGESVMAVARDGTIRYFNVRLAERNGVLQGHTNFVYGTAFHPDGERVASAAWDGTVRIWNATTGRELAVLKHSEGTIVSSVAFHPDGRHLISQDRDNDVRLWDLETNREIHRFPLSTKFWRDCRLAFSRDGRLLASSASDNSVHVWDFASRKEIAVLKGHVDTVRDLVFGPDGTWLATGSEVDDSSLRIWDLTTGNLLTVLTEHANVVYSLALSPDGKFLASGSHDGTVRLWNTTTWESVATLKQGTNVYGLSFAPDGKRLAVACANNIIRLWDLATYKAVGELHGHTAYIHQVAFSPDGSRLVSASGDLTLRVWDSLSATAREQTRSVEGPR